MSDRDWYRELDVRDQDVKEIALEDADDWHGFVSDSYASHDFGPPFAVAIAFVDAESEEPVTTNSNRVHGVRWYDGTSLKSVTRS